MVNSKTGVGVMMGWTIRKAAALIMGAMLVAGAPASADTKSALAQLQADLPGQLANDPTRTDWPAYGPGTAVRARKLGDAPGGAALEVTIPARGATAYANGLNISLTRAVREGQNVVVSIRARVVASDAAGGKGLISVRFQENSAPYPGFGDRQLSIGPDWQLYEVSARATRDLPAGLGVVGLQLGGARQTLQIAQIIVQTDATSLLRTAAAPACKSATPTLMPQLAGQGELLTDINALNWDVSGPVESSRLAACGIAGDSAMRFAVASPGETPHAAVAIVPLLGPIRAGDSLILAVIARTASATSPNGMGRLGLRIQTNAPPYDGFADHLIELGPNWKLIQLRTTATQAIAAGQGAVALHLAALTQTIDIGRVYLIRTASAP